MPDLRGTPDAPRTRPETPLSRRDRSDEENSLGRDDTPSFNLAEAASVALDIIAVDGRQGTPASVGRG